MGSARRRPPRRSGVRRLVPSGPLGRDARRRARAPRPHASGGALQGAAPAVRASRRGRPPPGRFASTVADRIGLPDETWLAPAVAPPHPDPPGRCRLGPTARTIIGSALIAAGEDIPRERAPLN